MFRNVLEANKCPIKITTSIKIGDSFQSVFPLSKTSDNYIERMIERQQGFTLQKELVLYFLDVNCNNKKQRTKQDKYKNASSTKHHTHIFKQNTYNTHPTQCTHIPHTHPPSHTHTPADIIRIVPKRKNMFTSTCSWET